MHYRLERTNFIQPKNQLGSKHKQQTFTIREENVNHLFFRKGNIAFFFLFGKNIQIIFRLVRKEHVIDHPSGGPM